MSWMILTLVSALMLGLYDVAKKVSVRGNAVPMVLLVSVSVSAIIWTVMLLVQTFLPSIKFPRLLEVDAIDGIEHLALAAKAVLVGASWILAFFSLKNLPLSIAAPIRATSPLWTLFIAIVFLTERPAPLQWIGIAVVLGSFWALSLVGAKEGIRFRTDRAVWWMIVATVLGACSSVYDKLLLQEFGLRPATVQAWFSVYLVPVMVPLALRWYRVQQHGAPEKQIRFELRTSVLLISPLLLSADMAYFSALADPDALISIVSPLRRSSVVVALIFGSRMAGEVNIFHKAACVLGILTGIVLLMI
ncbi:EamA family transporter [Aporhodopirellula aestuarii]|uniref:EamA family transporter n=1 Tax=Aporhodopirellula aestuarii TaxID=2950107 RepID=A0ABT0U601_9BACT|nr:EamA family transporter [Aporhodopirellula aestuarii]MCM2372227.1 EamA family transporter [Aporhodopirellula aestuarii]